MFLCYAVLQRPNVEWEFYSDQEQRKEFHSYQNWFVQDKSANNNIKKLKTTQRRTAINNSLNPKENMYIFLKRETLIKNMTSQHENGIAINDFDYTHKK